MFAKFAIVRALFVALALGSVVACTFEGSDEEEQGSKTSSVSGNKRRSGADGGAGHTVRDGGGADGSCCSASDGGAWGGSDGGWDGDEDGGWGGGDEDGGAWGHDAG
jgi:hypothetical protein